MGGPPGHIGCSCCLNHRGDIKGVFYTSMRRCDRPRLPGCCWSYLPPCHSVNSVVHTDDDHFNIATGRMNQVIASDRSQISITADHHDFLFGKIQLDTRREGNGPAVGCMEYISVEVGTDNPRRTADSGDEDEIIHRHPQLIDSLQDTLQNRPVPTARTECCRLYGGTKVFPQRVLDGAHWTISSIFWTT